MIAISQRNKFSIQGEKLFIVLVGILDKVLEVLQQKIASVEKLKLESGETREIQRLP